ncbi:MAG: hypothetical protein J6P03_04725, partial [Opitutales bacterium]|nr:hypothetical protein [Opitutales bacterium]
NGDVCVIDYKTFNNIQTRKDASVPDAFHRASELDPISGERVLKWADLQLPLYVEAYKRQFKPAGSVSCAYFIMAKRIEDCGIYEWNIPPDVLADALACADEVVGDILARKFGGAESSREGEPAREHVSRKITPKPVSEKYDDFAKYFSFADGKIEDFIEWEKGDGQ